jgi:hypothetical protein
MTSDTSLLTMELTPDQVMKQIRVHGWSWTTAGAVFGLCFGFLSPLAGLLLTAIEWFTHSHWHGYFIHNFGTVLFFLTFPLLIFGAHCLDLLDQKDEAAKARRPKVDKGIKASK